MTGVALAEELLLLAYDDTTGKATMPRISLDLGMAAAVLVELALAGRIAFADGSLTVIDPTPTGEPFSDEVLGRIAADTPHTPASWVQRLRHGLRDRILADLCRQGVVRDVDETELGFIHVHRYPVVDTSVEAETRQRLAEALTGAAAPDERTAALATLVVVLRMESALRRERRGRRRRPPPADGDRHRRRVLRRGEHSTTRWSARRSAWSSPPWPGRRPGPRPAPLTVGVDPLGVPARPAQAPPAARRRCRGCRAKRGPVAGGCCGVRRQGGADLGAQRGDRRAALLRAVRHVAVGHRLHHLQVRLELRLGPGRADHHPGRRRYAGSPRPTRAAGPRTLSTGSPSRVAGVAARIRAIASAITRRSSTRTRELVGVVHAELGGQLVQPVGQRAPCAFSPAASSATVSAAVMPSLSRTCSGATQ